MLLNNAALATVFAVIAFAFGYCFRSPAYRHAAWVIVLLKLVAPPLIVIPLLVLPASWQTAEPTPAQAPDTVRSPAQSSQHHSPSCQCATAPINSVTQPNWGIAQYLLVVWGAGTVGWFLLQTRRILRFRRGVQLASDAPEAVKLATSQLAERLGIKQPPPVKLSTGIGSPMLWGWSRDAVILFPTELLNRLSPEARDTLLAHELAHYLRRDHWVRILEFVVSGLFWWHPLVWLARREIEAAEEECCDAWVVGGLNASPRLYASALLATVDFEAELRRPCLPPGACAASHSARLLHRRLLAIIHADRPHQVPNGIWMRLLVGLVLITQPVLRSAPQDLAPSPEEPVEAYPETQFVSQRMPPKKTEQKPRVVEPRTWANTTAPITGLAILARDREIVLRRADGETRVLGPGRPIAVAFSPCEQRIATVGPGSLVRSWDHQGQLIAESHIEAAARSVVITPDGSSLLVLDAQGRITIHDPKTLKIQADWRIEGTVNSIACSPDGKTLAVSLGSWRSESGSVECWSIAERRKQVTYFTPTPVGASRFSPDGKTLIIGGWSGQLYWHSFPDGALTAERQLPKHLVSNAAFSPDADTLPIVPPELPPPPTPEPPNLFMVLPSRIAFNTACPVTK
jgi:bla regulator protein blaR1